jgi:hypothetical protein
MAIYHNTMSGGDRGIWFTIGTTYVNVGWAYTEEDVESWRKLAEGESDRAICAGPNGGSTVIEVKADIATISLDSDWHGITTELPAVLVRAEIARCLE